MSGASNVLDPVEAAKNDISRSKHLIASTLDDLSQHHSWLEDYHRAERRRAERLRRKEALRRLELRRQRAAWTLRRCAIATYAAARAATAFAIRHGNAFAAWAAPWVQLLARQAQSVLSAALSWSSRTAPLLAREGKAAATKGYEAAARGFAWSVQASDDAGIVFRRAASARANILSTQLAEMTAPTRRRAAIALARTRHRAWAQTRLLEARFTLSVTRAARDAQHLLERYTQGHGTRTGRALIVRPNTALARIEPVRAKLPAIRAR
jgi:hypothetical protein